MLNPQPKPQKRPKRAPSRLQRKARLKARSTTRKRNGADPAYLEAVRGLPCFLSNVGDGANCGGPVHAHHAIHRSQGGRDRDAVPLCQRCHRNWHEGTGFFRGMTREFRRQYADAMVAATRLELVGRATKGETYGL